MAKNYQESRDIERQGLDIMLAWAQARNPHLSVTEVDGKEAQKYMGDIHLGPMFIEAKTEQTNKHRNIFLETWSNKKWAKRSWLWHFQGDWYWYYFLESDELYFMHASDLWNWCFNEDGTESSAFKSLPEKHVECDQLNDAWGRPVPIYELKRLGILKGPEHPKQDLAQWKNSSSFQPIPSPPGSQERSCGNSME